MTPLRKKRLESSILRELAQLIMRQQTKDDRIEFVTVRSVELAKDASTAKIYLSFFGSSQSNALCYKAVKAKIGSFQSAIGRNLGLRITPRITLLTADTAAEYTSQNYDYNATER